MKILSTSGHTLIISAPARRNNSVRIPWPDNAVFFYEVEIRNNTSGLYICSARFDLAGPIQFRYIAAGPGTLEQAHIPFDAFRVENYPVPGGPWEGETFNSWVRPVITDKWTIAQFDAWLLT